MHPSFRLVFLVFIVFLVAGCENDATLRDDWNGTWIGSIDMQPYPELMTMNIDSSAIVKLFYHNVDYVGAKHFIINDDSLILQVDDMLFSGEFRGKMIDNDSIVGIMEIGQEQFRAGFVRTVPMGFGEATEYNGFYRLAPGHVVEVSPYVLDFTLNPLTIMDYKTGVKRLTFPKGNEKFWAGKKMLTPYPHDFSFEFVRQDSSIFFKYDNEQDATELGERLADLTQQKEITVANDDVSLQGTITYPATEGPYPLVIFVTGRGQQFRGSMIDDFVRLLPYYGVATLLYDKRGCGASTGDLETSNFLDLAEDLESILNFTANDSSIQQNNIGFLGIDEAGLIMPVVASRNPLVKFIVSLSGTVFSKEEQEYQACAMRMRADGFSEEAINNALAHQKILFDFIKGKVSEQAFRQSSEQVKSQPWVGYVTLHSQREFVEWWKKNYNISPRPYLEQLTIPHLVIFGENDLLIPPKEAAAAMQQILNKNGHHLNQLEIFPRANHLLMLGEKRGDFQFSEIEGYPEGLFELINEWIGDAVGLK